MFTTLASEIHLAADHSPPQERELAKFQLDQEKMDGHGLRFSPNTQFQDVFDSEQNKGFYSQTNSLPWGCDQSQQPGMGHLCSLISLALTELRFDVLLVILSSSRGSQEKVLSFCSSTKEAHFVQMHTPDCICVVSTRVPRNSWRLWPWIITGICNTYCGATVIHPIYRCVW